jgi:hypothetical protein
MTIARKLLGKHNPGVTLPTIEGHPLLGNGPINTHSRTTEEKCFPGCPCRGIIRESNSEAGSCKSSQSYTENENGASPRQSRRKGSAEDLL